MKKEKESQKEWYEHTIQFMCHIIKEFIEDTTIVLTQFLTSKHFL